MRTLSILTVTLLFTTTTTLSAQQNTIPELKGKTVREVFNELLPGMGAEDQGARRNPQQQWQNICFRAGTPGKEKLRLEACQVMIEKLGSKTPDPARIWLLKQLERIGRGESVEAVSAVLNDKNPLVRDGAVRCLANNPDPKATARLLAQLPKSKGQAKVALINALGYRADPSAVQTLVKELQANDSAVAQAAARALGKIATPGVAKHLADARGDAKGSLRLWICDAYLLCADRYLKAGQTKEAAAIYNDLYQTEKLRPIRLAALEGMIKTSGDQAGVLIFDILDSKDTGARNIALASVQTINTKALNDLTSRSAKLPEERQVRLLRVLASRGDKSQMPVALAAARSKNQTLQQAGLLALGRLGDASVVPMLLDTLFENSPLSGAARTSLQRLAAKGVNEKLITALKTDKDVNHKANLISLLEARRAAAALPVLLDEAMGEEASLRTRAMSALRQIAEPEDIPALIPALLKAKKGSERENAERTILTVSKRIVDEKERPEVILAAVNEKNKAALLPLLGGMGGEKTYQLARAALTSKSEELYDAGVVALCNWPDPSVSDDLLKLAKQARKPEQRNLAFTNLVRVNSLDSERPNEQKLETLKQAMKLAQNKEMRQFVLNGLSKVKHIETLRYVLPYLKDKELQQAACRTIVELAHSRTLRRPHQKEFIRALDQVIPICRNNGLIERAKKYKDDF